MARVTMNDLKRKMTNPHLDLFSTEKARQNPSHDGASERIQMISIQKLITFSNHPFHVVDDEKMDELKESITNNGILTPILVREHGEDAYEIISGHRRRRAAELLEIQEVPVVIRKINDEESVILMVDSNIQRETLLYSEKAFAYKMKLEAVQSKKSSSTATTDESGQVVHKKSRDILAETNPDSGRQIQRYIRLTHLIPDLLALVDLKKLSFNAGVELSYLSDEEQNVLCTAMTELSVIPSLVQATKIKTCSQEENFDPEIVYIILGEAPTKERNISLPYANIKKYFAKDCSVKDMEKTILGLLEEWKKQQV